VGVRASLQIVITVPIECADCIVVAAGRVIFGARALGVASRDVRILSMVFGANGETVEWGKLAETDDGSSRATQWGDVRRRVSALRRELRARLGCPDVIETVWGKGYALALGVVAYVEIGGRLERHEGRVVRNARRLARHPRYADGGVLVRTVGAAASLRVGVRRAFDST
jgi:DNA-binding winged helix-turn-helix (wHTH) protein